MNVSLLDGIYVLFLILMMIFGYFKGLTTRLFDLAGTILVFTLSYFLVKPLASIIKIYHYNETDFIVSVVGEFINQIIVFIILFFVLMVIKKILAIFLKPVLKKVTHAFSLTAFTDGILGAIVSGVEAIFLSYIVIVFGVIPFVPQGVQMVEESIIVSRVFEIVPDVSKQVIDITQTLKQPEMSSIESITKLVLSAHDLGIISSEQMQTILEENVFDELSKQSITLTSEEKQMIEDLLKDGQMNSKEIYNLLSNIKVSGG